MFAEDLRRRMWESNSETDVQVAEGLVKMGNTGTMVIDENSEYEWSETATLEGALGLRADQRGNGDEDEYLDDDYDDDYDDENADDDLDDDLDDDFDDDDDVEDDFLDDDDD